MSYTDEELQALYGDVPTITPPPAVEDVPYKTLKQFANIIPQAGNKLFQSAVGLFGEAAGGTQSDVEAAGSVIPTFDVGPSTGLKDVVLNQVAPEIASWLVPYLGATKGVKALAGAGRGAEITAEAIGQGGANLISAVRSEDQAEPETSGLMGAASGALQAALPRWQRALPLAAVSALAYANNGNAMEAIGNFAGNMLPGAAKGLKAITEAPLPVAGHLDEVASAIKPYAPHAQYDLGSFSFMDEVPGTAAKGRIETPGPIPHFEETSLEALNKPKLQRQTQPEFQLEKTEAPSDLRLTEDNHFPREESNSLTAPIEQTRSGLNLTGQPRFNAPAGEQAEFPIIALQAERGLPPGAPNFTMALETPRFTEAIPELSGWRNAKVNEPAKLSLEDTKISASSTPEVPKVPYSPVETPAHPVGSTEEKIAELQARLDSIPKGKANSAAYKKRNALKADLTEQIKTLKEAAPSVDQPTLPSIMTKTGDFLEIQPKMDGPHILSTVWDEGDGTYFASKDDWKMGHAMIFVENAEHAAPEGSSAFLIQDKTGKIRVTTDRHEALEIAKISGQTAKVKGELHSHDLINPVAKMADLKPKPAAVLAEEVLKVNDTMAGVEAVLRQDLEKARITGGTELRIASRKLHDFLAATKPQEAAEQEASAASKAGTVDVDPKMAMTGKDSIARFRSRYSNEAGFVKPELANTLAIASIGGVAGLVAYQKTKGDVGASIASAVIVMGLGAYGLSRFKGFQETVGDAAKIDLSSTKSIPISAPAAKITQLAIDTAHTPAGLAVGSRAGVWPQAINLIEALTGVNQTAAFKSAKVKADGFVAARMEELAHTFDAIKSIKPTATFQAAEGRFLRGQLANPADVQNILNAGGAVTGEDFARMTSANKAAFPEKWMILDNPDSTNVHGPGVEVWRVSNATKAKLIQAQKDALRIHASTPDDLVYMSFPLKYREVADNIMTVYHDALPPGANKDRLIGTTGQYIARSHAVITDPKAYPTEPVIQNAMDRLGILKDKSFLLKTEAQLSPTPTHTTAVTWDGNTYFMKPTDAMDFKYLHSPESLRGEVRDYIKEIRQRAQLKGLGAIDPDSEQFTSSLFTGRKELDEVTQALLGTHKLPSEMYQSTLNKIIPAGQAASFMKDAVRALDPLTGLKSALNDTEYNQAIEIARKAMAGGDVAAKNKYNELLSYTKSAKNDRYGLTSDMFVSRGLNERMSGFDGSPFSFLDNPIGQGLHNFNSFFKTTHLALSPASIARQFVQSPLMMAMGGVRDIGSIVNGFNGYMNRSSGVGKWMNEWGVFSASAKHGDFNHTLQEVLSGEMDRTIWGSVKRGVSHMHGMFTAADDITRASVFMAEAKRAAKDFGVPLDSFDPRVAARAQAFMLRRAMDFSNLPEYVKIGREIPFVNIFLAYTHEIARVAFNTAVDASKGDLQAGATLGGLAALPFMAQKLAEDSLSPTDKKAWQTAQNLAPAYSRPRFKLPIGRNPDGSFNYFDITSILPFSDYQMMARAAVKGDIESLALVNPAMGLDNSPVFNVIGPQVAGRDFHTQREFRDMGDRVKNAAKQLLPGLTPGIGTEYVKDVPEALGGELGITNLKNARTNTSIGAWLRNTTGIDYTQISPDIATRNAVAAAKGDIATERQYLKDVLMQQGISEDAKKRATDRFINSVQHIVGNLQARLQLQPTQ